MEFTVTECQQSWWENSKTLLLNVLLISVATLVDSSWMAVKRGFFCSDESLNRPLRENTISTDNLIFIWLSMLLLVVILVECVAHRRSTWERRFEAMYTYSNNAVFGVVVISLITSLAKFNIGRLR